MLNLLNCILMIIHEKIHPLVGFDVVLFRMDWWYRWEAYPVFRRAYFVVGMTGTVMTKKVCGIS